MLAIILYEYLFNIHCMIVCIIESHINARESYDRVILFQMNLRISHLIFLISLVLDLLLLKPKFFNDISKILKEPQMISK